MNDVSVCQFLSSPGHNGSNEERIAYKINVGSGPTFIWCGGLKSDMEGGKARALHDWAARKGRGYIRFDYYGHGVSSGEFEKGTMSRWAQDTVQVIDDLTAGDVVLIGSSMGGWASLLAMLDRPLRVKGLIFVNPAPDFTEKLTYANWDETQRATLDRDGVVYEPSDYDAPYAYTKALIDDGRSRQILDAPIAFDGPVRILQGEADAIVPPDYSKRIVSVVTSQDVRYILVKGGDHSLSRPQDLDLLLRTADEIITRL